MGDIPYITTLSLNGTLPCVDFMDVIMGDIPYITTLCLNGTLPCVDFMDVIMGDIPYITTLCLNGTLSCVDFMDVTMGDTPASHTTDLHTLHNLDPNTGVFNLGYAYPWGYAKGYQGVRGLPSTF